MEALRRPARETLPRSGRYDFDMMLFLPKRRFPQNLHVFEQVSGGEEGLRDVSSVGSQSKILLTRRVGRVSRHVLGSLRLLLMM